MTFIMQYIAENGHEPTRAHGDDAGFDLYVKGHSEIGAGQSASLDLGVAVKAPARTWLLLTGRSSAFRNLGLYVHQGIIDTGYTGPLYATVTNTTTKKIKIADKQRIAQLVVMPNLTESTDLWRTDALPQTERGANGFGSSGQ